MSGLIPVADALARVLANIAGPVEGETVPIVEAGGRVLAEPVVARFSQPPFMASAMDGYALRSTDAAEIPAELRLIGTSAAGHGFEGTLGAKETVRIFTGAPVPQGADAILIQEDAEVRGDTIVAREPVTPGRFLRPAGLDFRDGDVLLRAGDTLDARKLALAASSGQASVGVRRRPRVAILSTGDELVQPGEARRWDQIVASNALSVGLLAREAGAEVIDLGIAADTTQALTRAIARARSERADLLVTLGGASVGDHDLVQGVLREAGMDLAFWRVALRPGKPLMSGRLGPMAVIGLPGNPVSAIVCGVLFVVPAIRALLGDPAAGADRSEPAILGRDLPENDRRQDYMRAGLELGPDRLPIAHPENRQDSSMLAVLGRSEALLIRAPNAPPALAGEPCRIIRLDRRLV